MSEFPSRPVPLHWHENAWINKEKYQQMYQQSIDQPDLFWSEQASEF